MQLNQSESNSQLEPILILASLEQEFFIEQDRLLEDVPAKTTFVREARSQRQDEKHDDWLTAQIDVRTTIANNL